MASPAFEAGRPGTEAVEVARLVERGLRGSGAIDTEALCVLAGRKVRAGGCVLAGRKVRGARAWARVGKRGAAGRVHAGWAVAGYGALNRRVVLPRHIPPRACRRCGACGATCTCWTTAATWLTRAC